MPMRLQTAFAAYGWVFKTYICGNFLFNFVICLLSKQRLVLFNRIQTDLGCLLVTSLLRLSLNGGRWPIRMLRNRDRVARGSASLTKSSHHFSLTCGSRFIAATFLTLLFENTRDIRLDVFIDQRLRHTRR